MKTRTLNEKQMRQLKNEWTNKSIDLVTMMFLMALRDEFGYGEKRLERVLTRVDSLAESIRENRLTIYDIQKTIKEETGLDYKLRK